MRPHTTSTSANAQPIVDNAKYGSDVLLLHLVGDDTFPLDMNSGSTDTDHHPKDHTSIPLTLPHASAPSSRKVSTHKHAKSKSSPKCHSPSFATRSIEAQPISFVGSDAEVNSYLGSRFQRLQQLATKKLVKAWIKGICPNKQALFPYQSNKTGKGPRSLPNTPGWWPQQDGVCRFRAPDHLRRAGIRKHSTVTGCTNADLSVERTRLCMHILRLRPTPQHLASWNSSTTEHNKVHASSGWTEFLRSLAGPNIFDDLTDQRSDKLKLRRALLSEIYSIAALEEQFCTRRGEY